MLLHTASRAGPADYFYPAAIVSEEMMAPDSLNLDTLEAQDPDVTNSFKQIVMENGCELETHTTTTSDGYVLTVFRINKTGTKKFGYPVFLQHGLFSSSETWIMNNEKSVAFQFANAGYDVWLGNNRGCLYSRKNTKFDPETDQYDFFNYSFFELG